MPFFPSFEDLDSSSLPVRMSQIFSIGQVSNDFSRAGGITGSLSPSIQINFIAQNMDTGSYFFSPSSSSFHKWYFKKKKISETDSKRYSSHLLFTNKIPLTVRARAGLQTRSQEHNPGLPCGSQGIKYLSHHSGSPGFTLAGSWSQEAVSSIKLSHLNI